MPTVHDDTRSIDALRPDPKNARRHPAHQIDAIATSIKTFGMVAPIIIRPDGTLIGGEATLTACRKLEHRSVACRVVEGLTDRQYRALGLALNRLPEQSQWDDGLLADALRSLDHDDAAAAGFSDAELLKLAAEPEQIAVEEIDTTVVFDEFWISVRGSLKHQAVMLEALQRAAKDLDGVTVDLGTISH
jgi:ParB-like chromosome segregation protein Spo0J